jgi:hypothetical protein
VQPHPESADPSEISSEELAALHRIAKREKLGEFPEDMAARLLSLGLIQTEPLWLTRKGAALLGGFPERAP